MKSYAKSMYEDVTLNKPFMVSRANRNFNMNEICIKVFYNEGAYYASVKPQERSGNSVTEITMRQGEDYRGVCVQIGSGARFSGKVLKTFFDDIINNKRIIKLLFQDNDMDGITRLLLAYHRR